MNSRRRPNDATWLELPEVNVAIFAFLLNFVWEIWQMPLYEATANSIFFEGIAGCTLATFGDAAITLIGFWSVAAVVRSRQWVLRPNWPQVAGFVTVGIVITILLETLATGPLDRWNYSDSMPLVPIVHIGLTPFLQWLFLPPLVVWFVRRQL